MSESLRRDIAAGGGGGVLTWWTVLVPGGVSCMVRAPPAPAGTPLSPKLNPPRLGPVRELEALDRLVLRSGEVVRIDPMRGDSDDGPEQVPTIGGRP